MRIGYSWRTGPGTRMWISMPLWAWCLFWLLAIVPLVLWWALKLLILITVAIVRAVERAHAAPAVPGPLRAPPSRQRER